MRHLRELLCDFGIHSWRWHKCDLHDYDWCQHCLVFRPHKGGTVLGSRDYMEYVDNRRPDPRD